MCFVSIWLGLLLLHSQIIDTNQITNYNNGNDNSGNDTLDNNDIIIKN